jgi:hypothetical protein
MTPMSEIEVRTGRDDDFDNINALAARAIRPAYRAIAFYEKYGFDTGQVVGEHKIPRKLMKRSESARTATQQQDRAECAKRVSHASISGQW